MQGRCRADVEPMQSQSRADVKPIWSRCRTDEGLGGGNFEFVDLLEVWLDLAEKLETLVFFHTKNGCRRRGNVERLGMCAFRVV